jgi:hypothetical protein
MPLWDQTRDGILALYSLFPVRTHWYGLYMDPHIGFPRIRSQSHHV